MSSNRKIQSARANGAKSRGPKTEKGKKKSSQNALKHGLAASAVVIQHVEEQADFDSLLQEYVDYLQPHGPVELDLVEQMVVAKWRQSRAWEIETTLLDVEMDLKEEHIKASFKNPDNHLRLALAFDSLAGEKRSLVHLNRYESRLRRQYERALRDLRALRAEREPRPQPPAPQPDTSPRAPEPAPPPCQNDFLQNEPNPEIAHPQPAEQNHHRAPAGAPRRETIAQSHARNRAPAVAPPTLS